MALLKDSRFSVRMAYVMRTENQSNGRAHGCDHAQIFCAHGLIHAHRKSRIIGVRMAMCTSKPIIGKDAAWGGCDSARDIFEEGVRPLLPQVLLQLVRHPLVLVPLTFHLEGIIMILSTKMFCAFSDI